MHRSLLTISTALVLALAPAGVASAGDTGNGKAHGNCQNSSAGGVHEPLPGSAGNGNGGHRKGETCSRGPVLPPVDPEIEVN